MKGISNLQKTVYDSRKPKVENDSSEAHRYRRRIRDDTSEKFLQRIACNSSLLSYNERESLCVNVIMHSPRMHFEDGRQVLSSGGVVMDSSTYVQLSCPHAYNHQMVQSIIYILLQLVN